VVTSPMAPEHRGSPNPVGRGASCRILRGVGTGRRRGCR
jgi:hypothetical protein